MHQRGTAREAGKAKRRLGHTPIPQGAFCWGGNPSPGRACRRTHDLRRYLLPSQYVFPGPGVSHSPLSLTLCTYCSMA